MMAALMITNQWLLTKNIKDFNGSNKALKGFARPFNADVSSHGVLDLLVPGGRRAATLR